MVFLGDDLALVPNKLVLSRRFAVWTMLLRGGTLYCVCSVLAVRRGLSPPPGHQRCGGGQALPPAPLFWPGGGWRAQIYPGFISSPNREEVFRERLSQCLWAGIEKKYCRAPALGCWKAVETQSHALKCLNCIRRDQATEEITQDPCHGRLQLWLCSQAGTFRARQRDSLKAGQLATHPGKTRKEVRRGNPEPVHKAAELQESN